MQKNTVFLSLSILVQILCVYAPRLLFSSISFVQYHWVADVIVVLMCIRIATEVVLGYPLCIYIFAYILVYTCAHAIGFVLLTWCPKELLLLLSNNSTANQAQELLGAPTIMTTIVVPNLFTRLRDIDTAIASLIG